MDNLSFDPIKVDTALAKAYIHNKDVIEEPKPGTAWDYQNKTVINIVNLHDFKSLSSVTNLNQKLRNLSKKLQDNSELFCQLEYLMRNTDVEETRNCHLKLISQYLRLEEGKKKQYWSFIVMEDSTPLYYLGHVAALFRDEYTPVVFCKKTTAPICELFYELCLDVGLNISLFCINKTDQQKLLNCLPELPPMGCTLAITEEADMDSAVDVFLNSSVKAPWRIERIYVQESVYDQLMEALEARCSREASDRCVDTFRTARGRVVECGAGAGAGGGVPVPVRAYRGARDLLALLPPGGSLSLWCGAAAAAHELALAAPAHLVWIDHYAAFDGPPAASIPLYNFNIERFFIPESIETRLLKLQRTWTALSLDERKAVVLEVLKVYDCKNDASMLAEDIADWMAATDLVDIASDRITMVINHLHTETLLIDSGYKYMLEVLKSAILGYRIVISLDLNVNNTPDITSELCNAGVPVTKSEVSSKTSKFTHEIKSKLFYSNKKVIHSRFGTIFSN